MIKNISFFPELDLQLFAEGGAAGEGGTGAEGNTGVNEAVAALQEKISGKNPLADVKYGIQDDAQPAEETKPETPALTPEQRQAEFEKLIKGEYKDLYDARMQDTIQRRLKSSKEVTDKYNALTPVLEMLGRKYGIDASDADKLAKAIENDDSYYEEEAMEKGMSVEQLKATRKLERENAELKRQMDERTTQENTDRLYAQWTQQAEETKKVYPSFDINAELQNPLFQQLLRNNIDVRTAFEVIHKDDIIPAAMQYTAKTVEQKLTNKIIANGQRPAENGLSAQGAANVKADVSQLTKEDRAEIIRRVARGEKIRF